MQSAIGLYILTKNCGFRHLYTLQKSCTICIPAPLLVAVIQRSWQPKELYIPHIPMLCLRLLESYQGLWKEGGAAP